MDEILIARHSGQLAEQFRIAEKAAEARVYSQLYELPKVLKDLEGEMKKREVFIKNASIAQESGGIGTHEDGRRIGTTPIIVDSGKTLADTLKERKDRMARSERSN